MSIHSTYIGLFVALGVGTDSRVEANIGVQGLHSTVKGLAFRIALRNFSEKLPCKA